MKHALTILVMIMTPILMSLVMTGCSTVHPWEKGYLSKHEMTLETDKLDTAFTEHVYFSKEASSGGNGVGGGGCGCN